LSETTQARRKANGTGDVMGATVTDISAARSAWAGNGFITLHRTVLDWPLYRYLRADQRHVITTLLMLANWKPSVVWVAGQRYEVGRGELVHTEETIGEEAGCGRQVVRTVLDLLSKDGFISTRELASEGTRRVRAITIRNYDRFQSAQEKPNPVVNLVPNHTPTRDQPEANQRPTPSEPSKPVKPSKPIKTKAPPSADAVAAKDALYAHWKTSVWPRVSSEPLPEVPGWVFGKLSDLAKTYPVESLKAFMTSAPDHEYWGSRLTLQIFVSRIEAFLPRTAGPPKASMLRGIDPVSEFKDKGDQPL
jgi:hypothetical protein